MSPAHINSATSFTLCLFALQFLLGGVATIQVSHGTSVTVPLLGSSQHGYPEHQIDRREFTRRSPQGATTGNQPATNGGGNGGQGGRGSLPKLSIAKGAGKSSPGSPSTRSPQGGIAIPGGSPIYKIASVPDFLPGEENKAFPKLRGNWDLVWAEFVPPKNPNQPIGPYPNVGQPVVEGLPGSPTKGEKQAVRPPSPQVNGGQQAVGAIGLPKLSIPNSTGKGGKDSPGSPSTPNSAGKGGKGSPGSPSTPNIAGKGGKGGKGSPESPSTPNSAGKGGQLTGAKGATGKGKSR